MLKVKIVTTIKQLKTVKAEIARLEAIKADLEDTLKAEMISRGVDELEAGTERVTWHESTAHTFDSKSLKADMPEIHAKYYKEYQRRTFLVK